MILRATVLGWLASVQLALLATAWVVPTHGGGACPHARNHAAAAEGGHAADGAHAAHADPAPAGEPAPHPGGDCDCVGQCCVARAPVLPVAAPAEFPAAETVVRRVPAAPRAHPRPAFHLELLPFSTAPPIA